jgi:putative FmdB family regulatory protein
MPLYEYKCSKCEKTFEVMQKFSDAPLTVHGECGGSVERLLSAPAFQLKGTGWYITDYARGGKSGNAESGTAKGDGASAAESKSADGSKSESTKSGNKSETKTSSSEPASGTTKSS